MGISNSPGAASSGSRMLDSVPPSPNAKIFSKPTPPGSDTTSLLGDSADDETGSNSALATAGNRLMLSQSMFMQAVNLRESIQPGSVPEPIKQWVAQQMTEVPLMAEQMARGGQPGAMLSAVGQTGTQAGSPMGAPAFGPPMGGGSGSGVGQQPPAY